MFFVAIFILLPAMLASPLPVTMAVHCHFTSAPAISLPFVPVSHNILPVFEIP
jgi:hypothetical protein